MPTGTMVVVGAGVVGLCCALALRDRGHPVVLLERGLPGAANTTMTGGGIRQQFGTAANIGLSRLAAPFWETFQAHFGVDPLFRPIGYLFLAHDDATAEELQRNVAMQKSFGVDSEAIDGNGISRRWPALAGRGVTGAAFRQGDGWANHHRIVDGLTRGCLAAGVDIRVGVEALTIRTRKGAVTGLATTDGDIDVEAVVLATGPWTGLLAPLGLCLPVIGRRHELLIVEPAEPLPPGLPWLIGVRDEVHMRPDAAGRALVGGFLGHDDPADPDVHERNAAPDWSRAVLAACGRVFGLVDETATVRHGWAGLYPGTPDKHPIIDRLGEGLYAAMGFSGTGLMHAPAAGLLLAELVTEGGFRSFDTDAFSAHRFGPEAQPTEATGF